MSKSVAAATLCAFLSLAALSPATGLAMGFGSGADATYDEGYNKAMEGKFAEAIDILKQVVEKTPDNADAWNMLGFSYRNKGDADNAWDAYEHALAINPQHKGAHEYIGEWYLMQGDLASAKAQLEKLGALCPDGCTEKDALAAAIEKAQGS